MDPEIVTEVLATASKERSAARGKTLAASPPTPPPEMNISLEWSSKSQANQLHQSPPDPQTLVAVIGVGYVGTHLVEAFSQHYNVIAYDLSEKRLQAVAEQLKGLPIKFTSCATSLGEATHILISVPTVLNDDKTIDTTYLRSAIADVEKYARPGSTIVVESSVAVGMTRQLVGPLMQSKNFKVGMSPEVGYSFPPPPKKNHESPQKTNPPRDSASTQAAPPRPSSPSRKSSRASTRPPSTPSPPSTPASSPPCAPSPPRKSPR